MKETKYPVLLGEYREDFPLGFKVWCPFCETYHLHGKGAGHKVAHCIDEHISDDGTITKISSPFKKTGYIIKDNRKIDK